MFPVAEDVGGGFGTDVAEDVRVAADHFVVNLADDVVDGKAVLFGGDLRVKEDLEEEVAQFFGEFGVVVGVKSVEDFVGFFDEVGAESGVSLFPITGTATGSTQAGHDGSKFGEGEPGVWGRGFFRFAGSFARTGRFFARHARFFLEK